MRKVRRARGSFGGGVASCGFCRMARELLHWLGLTFYNDDIVDLYTPPHLLLSIVYCLLVALVPFTVIAGSLVCLRCPCGEIRCVSSAHLLFDRAYTPNV